MSTIQNLGQIRTIEEIPGRAVLVRILTDPKSTKAVERLLVPTTNAVITDVVGVVVANIAFWSTDNIFFKIIAGLGGIWMSAALGNKITVLTSLPRSNLLLNAEEP